AAASAPGPCHHRLGLSPDALATLDQGGRVPLSQSWVNSGIFPTPDNPALYTRSDSVSLNFLKYDAAGVQVTTGILNPPQAGCALNVNYGVGAIIFAQLLDAGAPVVLELGGVRLPMTGSDGSYSLPPSATTYTLDKIPPSSFLPGD